MDSAIFETMPSPPFHPPLRLMICGSAAAGKSTLIRRLLHESISPCHPHAVEPVRAFLQQNEDAQQGSCGGEDSFFATASRHFIILNSTENEEETLSVARSALTADLAIILIDASRGIEAQARLHGRIVAMMGGRPLLLVVNKMDLIDYDPAAFAAVVSDFQLFAEGIGFAVVAAIPLNALGAGNISHRGAQLSWYTGPSLLESLEEVELVSAESAGRFRMPVEGGGQHATGHFGLTGRIAQGVIQVGDDVRVLLAGRTSRVREIIVRGESRKRAGVGELATLTLGDEVEAGRGEMIVALSQPPEVADQFMARILWLSQQPLVAGRPYLLRIHCREVVATVTAIKYRQESCRGARLAARSLACTEMAVVNLSLSQPVPFEPHSHNRVLGGFVCIDRRSGETVGVGTIEFALRRAKNIHWQSLDVSKEARAGIKHQQPCCIWLTGLSGSGKSTIANLLEKRLLADGHHTYLLDGDNLRHGLNRDLGFTEADRVENIRRVGEVARLMVDAGLIVLVSLISPYRAGRQMARELFAEGEFIEVFVDTPLSECERRDPKGLYAKARRGELKNFTGIDSTYEAPENPEIHLRGWGLLAEASVEMILSRLAANEVY